MICLDTNAVIAALKGGATPLVARCDRELPSGVLAVPSIVLFELRFGIAKSTRAQENGARLTRFLRSPITVLHFDADDAAEAGVIRAALERAGTPIGPYDVLIAAQARRRGAILVMANTREFARVPGLVLQDWFVP